MICRCVLIFSIAVVSCSFSIFSFYFFLFLKIILLATVNGGEETFLRSCSGSDGVFNFLVVGPKGTCQVSAGWRERFDTNHRRSLGAGDVAGGLVLGVSAGEAYADGCCDGSGGEEVMGGRGGGGGWGGGKKGWGNGRMEEWVGQRRVGEGIGGVWVGVGVELMMSDEPIGNEQ